MHLERIVLTQLCKVCSVGTDNSIWYADSHLAAARTSEVAQMNVVDSNAISTVRDRTSDGRFPNSKSKI